MASENVEDWDLSLPSSEISPAEEEEELMADQKQYNENLEKLQRYVDKMAYRPTESPPKFSSRTDVLAHPKKIIIVDNYKEHYKHMQPKGRGKRLRRNASKYATISTEQLEQIVKNQRNKDRKKESFQKRKQELYYEMLTKLERQCRTQYLNVLLRKFATFIAKLATTMRIPPQLAEPYSRMQRGLFCNILLAVGVQPVNQSAIYYNTPEGLQYEVCHKLAHALLSLIIKALDAAANKNPDDIQPVDTDFEIDNYIKDRLMCAAEKKITLERNQKKLPAFSPLEAIFKKCQNFSSKTAC